MQDGDNFFTKMDRSILLKQLEKEQMEAAQAAAKLEAEKEAEERRKAIAAGGARGGGGPLSPGGRPMLTPLVRPELNLSEDIEFKAIPADPMTVAETLVKVS